ncbi:MAG TPA: DUF4249 domain-containing protein [Parafilimonas sp.]|nr:DUF4249 domain-containing protein [Parafilimonas sp.]
MKKLFYILIFIAGCKEAYNPSLKSLNVGYLVAEGNIVAGNDSTVIHLSRTTSISDSSNITNPVTNAAVQIESEDGQNYQLQDEFDGSYFAPPLNISTNKKYRVHIFTVDGKEYASDYVPVKISPAIDSVSWKLDSTNGVNIYVNSHDAQGQTLYYQWKYVETWQHRATYTSAYVFENGTIRLRTPDEYITNCWTVLPASSINISSTTQLASDIVYEKRLVNIPYGSEKLSIVYSILVEQYALTKEAFQFWENLKKNTEQIGTIFDPQPFADFGNIHCITNPAEPVIGFISASSIEEQRIYIFKQDLSSWPYRPPLCEVDTLKPGDDITSVADGGFIPLYEITIPGTPETGLLITEPECADCRVHGGSTIKPPYMP